MTLPFAYTESTLAEFMLGELGVTATATGVTLSDLAEAVNETMLVYGCTDLATALDMRKIRAIARVEAWRTVCNAVAGDYDYSDAGASYSRSQALKNATQRLDESLARAAAYYPTYQATLSELTFTDDPYRTPDITLSGGSL